MRLILTLILALVTMPMFAQDSGESALLAAPVWTYGGLAITTGCTTASCAITVQHNAGEIMIALVAQTTGPVAVTGATGGGGTWHVCTACHVAAPDVFDLYVDVLYSTDATQTGSVTVTINLAGTPGASYNATVSHLSCTGCSAYGPITFDQAGTTVDETCTVCTVSSFTELAGQDMAFVFFYSTVPFPIDSWPAAFTLDPTVQDVLYSVGGSGAGLAAGNYTTVLTGTSSTTVVSTGMAFRP
jgi:hypothetical protein